MDLKNWMGRPVTVKDPALQITEESLITRHGGLTAVEIPTVPYSFTDAQRRLELGWLATMSLAALRKGRVTIKSVHSPTDVHAAQVARGERARQGGRVPSRGFDRYNTEQTEQHLKWQPTTKRTFALATLGARDVLAQNAWRQSLDAPGLPWYQRRPQPLAPLSEAESARWDTEAQRVRGVLARGGYRARPVGVDALRSLRRYALSRSTAITTSATGRSRWNPFDLVSEFDGIEVTPGPRWVRVDSDAGTVYSATFVCSAFPVAMAFPAVDPWLGSLDKLPFRVDTDLILDLVPAERAKGQVGQKQRNAVEQRNDAARAGMELPREVTEMIALAKELDYTIPKRRLPMAYGWARIRVDARTPADLVGMYDAVKEQMASIGEEAIDVEWPGGGRAQTDLLLEGIPGFGVRHKSWRQRWMLETAACSLQHAGSELGHENGTRFGHTTGRVQRSVGIDLHHAITKTVDESVQQPGGIMLLGAQRAGKSGTLMAFMHDLTMSRRVTFCIDPSGPLQRLADLPEFNGSRGPKLVEAVDLIERGGGVADPMGPVLIPMPTRPVDRDNPILLEGEMRRWEVAAARVRKEREALTRETLFTLAFRQIEGNPDAETAMLNAIRTVSASAEPSMQGVIEYLTRKAGAGTSNAARGLGAHLEFELLDSAEAGALAGHGGVSLMEDSAASIVTRIVSMRGLSLPKAGKALRDYLPREQLAAATFGCATYLARRLLFEMDPDVLKAFVVDELHVPMANPAGREVIESTLRDGPKHGVITIGATHNAADLQDEKVMNAVAMWFLFRSVNADEQTASFRASGFPDTPANRANRAGLRNGEALVKLDTAPRDRVQFDLWQRGLAEKANTTPAGAEGTGDVRTRGGLDLVKA